MTAMTAQDLQAELDPAEDLLRTATLAHLAYDGIDGTPRVSPAASKSMQGEELAAFEASVRETYDRMARISIRPDWVRYFDFTAGRFPDFLRALTPKN